MDVLHSLVRAGDADGVREFCDTNPPVDVHTAFSFDLLRVAARRNHVSVVRVLCDLPAEWGVDPSNAKWAALQCAARWGHVDVVRELCSRMTQEQLGACEVLIAAVSEGQLPVVQALCEMPGIRPDQDNNWPVELAAELESPAILEYLCGLPASRGVDPGANDNAPLMAAICANRLASVKFLCGLSHGVRVTDSHRTVATKYPLIARYLSLLPIA